MQKKHLNYLLSLALCLGSMTCATAAPISLDQARSIAADFMPGKAFRQVSVAQASKAPAQSQPYYVFNNQTGAGYVIVAGDDRVPAILGYSDQGVIDPNDIPPAMQQLLDGYAEQIGNLSGRPAKLIARQAIAPLVPCIWGQGEPFNVRLPFTRTSGGRAYHGKVGCVATAMAQVMYYHKWPNSVDYPVPGYTSKTNGYVMPELPATTFDWSLMKDTYNTTDSLNESGVEVAKFNLYCAQSLEMDFLASTSSASTSKIPNALVTYFDYDPTARYVTRANFNTTEWEDMLYAELQAKRPVVYRGDKNPGGHSFVCDGCDNTGLFHINWGWNGLSNGYWVLSDLNPDAQGIGGADGECGYIYGQGMVINIMPNQNNMPQTMIRYYNMVITGKNETRTSAGDNFSVTVQGRYLNTTSDEAVFDYGWGLFQGDNMLNTVVYDSRTNGLKTNYYFTKTYELNIGAGLADGTYYLRPIFSELFENEWQVCEGGMVNFVEVVITGNTAQMIAHGSAATPAYEASELTFEGRMHTGRQVTATATITNRGNTMGDMIYLFADGVQGNVALTDLEKNQTGEVTFYFTPETAGIKTITLSVNEDGSDPIITRTLDITAMPTASLTMTNTILNVTDAANKIITSDKYSVETTITNDGANAYDEDIVLRLYRVYNGTSGTNVQDVSIPVQLAPGETKVIRFDCDNVVSGERYFCWVYYFSAGEQVRGRGTASHTLIFPTGPQFDPGDVTGDGNIDVADINAVINIMLGKKTASEFDGQADVTGDGNIDVADINAVINAMLGK